MDVNTGHLVRDIELIEKLTDRECYTPVPRHLRKEAERALDGHDEAMVNLRLQSALADWAAAKKLIKGRARNRIAKAARKRNRK